ncbi:Os04g0648800 [Oryza sativa Japonica Group]|nr:Os04g0648800 [Oryza sativa Japonica Group]|eukprot:NP_001174121.1 Os04g0648800 [Oryza sativa Japonica Group]
MGSARQVLALVFPTGTIVFSITLLLRVIIPLLVQIYPLLIVCWFQALLMNNSRVMELLQLDCHLVAMILVEAITIQEAHKEVFGQELAWLNILAPMVCGHLQVLSDIPVVSSLNFQYQHPMNVVPGIPQMSHRFTGPGASSSRTGNLENRIIGSEEFSARNVVATSFPDAVPPAALDMRHLIPEPSSWNVDGRATTIPGNVPSSSRANTNSMVNPPAGSPFIAHQNLHRRNPRNLSEEISRLSGALRGHQHPRLRSGFLLERQGDGVWGVPLSTRSREGRRLIEIRNALEMIHRGENVRFESIFYGGVDIHDRHRDMRLDIDNMSYEELLALEERIGNVSTGLSEEEVTKLLKQRKFSSWRLEASVEEEPCCICQEEYVDGDDLGTLDCGHDFHVGCVRQWLVVKNTCPICKNTALKS